MKKEEGHYTIKRVEKIPKRGSSNFLYTEKNDNLTKYYRFLSDGSTEVIDLFSGQSSGGQNNKITSDFYGVIPLVNKTTVLAALNAREIVILEDEIYSPLIVENKNGVLTSFKYVVRSGKGNYGVNGTLLTSRDIALLEEKIITASDEGIEGETIDLGDIGAENISDFIDNGTNTYILENDSIYFFTTIEGADQNTYVFIGNQPITIGQGGTGTDVSDFGLIATNGENVNVITSTGLEAIDEGNGNGWRLIGRNPNNFGNIGLDAVDFGTSSTVSNLIGSVAEGTFTQGFENENRSGGTAILGFQNKANPDRPNLNSDFSGNNLMTGYLNTHYNNVYATVISGISNRVGTTGVSQSNSSPVAYYSFVGGRDNNQYAGRSGLTYGANLLSGSGGCTVLGVSNIDLTVNPANNFQETLDDDANPVLVIGNGSYNTSTKVGVRSNAFAVMRNGEITAPSTTIADVDNAGVKAIPTVEWVNANLPTTTPNSGLEFSLVSSFVGGWRLLDSEISQIFNNVQYGNIGLGATDLSVGFSTNHGATGRSSFATGNSTTASGRESSSFGRETFARSYGEFSVGVYGTDYTPNNTTLFDSEDRLFVIGNGTNSNRSDALTVYKNGALQIHPIDITNITNEAAGMLALDSNDLNRFKYHNGTDWKSFDSGFILASSATGEVDETKDLARSGNTSFGGDDPTRQLEVIGEFWNKEIFASSDSIVIESSPNLFSDFGLTGNLLSGVANTYREDGSNDFVTNFVGKVNVSPLADLVASFGVHTGSNPLTPTDYGRVFAYRQTSSPNMFVTDIETKNGADSNRLRVRTGRIEMNKPAQFTMYGDGILGEGDTYSVPSLNSTSTIGAPTFLAGFDSSGNVMEVPLNPSGYTVTTLPTVTVGDRAYVTDAVIGSFGDTVVGSGTRTLPVFFDGTNWILG